MSETRGNGTETTPKKISGTGTGERRVCAKPGCTVELSSENTCGRCRAHVRWQDRTSSAGNGHANAGSNGAHTNGSAKKTNGSNGHAAAPAGSNGAAAVLPGLAADRVDHLLATLTAGDKARIVTAWLKGEI